MPRRVAFVLGSSGGGMGAHARMLASGCAARGMRVAVYAPPRTGRDLGLRELPGVEFAPVNVGGRPRASDIRAILRLRQLLLGAGETGAAPGAAGSPGWSVAGVVHAHGLRAGALAVLALAGVRGARRPAVVVTVHNGPPGAVASALVYGMLARIVARGAGLVLCVSGDLEARMRAAGARHVGRAVVPAPSAGTSPGPAVPAPDPDGGALPPHAAGRPVVLGAGRLAAQKGFGTLLEAAVAWRDMDPAPLVVIAGSGPLEAGLRERAAALGVDAVFPGYRRDVPALLAAASVFVLPSAWEGQPLVLQEALRAGTPVVATQVGGVPELVGTDPSAALLVPPGDAALLAAAVRAVLTDEALATRLRTAALRRAAALPTRDGAIDAALASYDQALRPSGTR